ncbi:protein sym-1 [Eucalyptus grandis]|uniref:protein sym-1 n=1 Tax=Eucalyptus grandis TaxID=71139 RepID=UPI00192F06FE|nr:protein sym-1 [Eucalyptus grandis]
MIQFTGSVARQSPALVRLVSLSRAHPSHFAPVHAKAVQRSGLWSSPSCQNPVFPLNYGRSGVPRDSGKVEIGFGQLGFNRARFSAVSDTGSGGTGGDGGSGDKNYGGRGEGDGGEGGGSSGNNWSLLSWYLTLLAKYPVATKAVTSALLTFLGDLICQLVIDQAPSLDLKRNFSFTFLGLVLVGPTLHFWYLYLSRLVTVPGASGAIMRLLLDQFVFSPLFLGVFLATLVTLEGRPSDVVPKLQQEWFSAVLANWKLWIPFQFLNFRFVPQQFQVLAANVIALVWNVILSFKAHKEILPK